MWSVMLYMTATQSVTLLRAIMYQRLLLAISFYTRIPISKSLDYAYLPQASVFLPMIGWLIGGCAAMVFYGAVLYWSKLTALILSVCVTVLLTGGFHEDGFIDVCDGFGAGANKERVLSIMKDSFIGSYALVGLVLLFALKFSVLLELPNDSLPFVLLAAHSLSRFAPLYLMYRYDYVRFENNKVGFAVYRPNIKQLGFAALCAMLPLLTLPPWSSVAIFTVMFVTDILGCYFYRRIGGYTGDCLGATQQISEIIFYLTVSALWKFI